MRLHSASTALCALAPSLFATVCVCASLWRCAMANTVTVSNRLERVLVDVLGVVNVVCMKEMNSAQCGRAGAVAVLVPLRAQRREPQRC